MLLIKSINATIELPLIGNLSHLRHLYGLQDDNIVFKIKKQHKILEWFFNINYMFSIYAILYVLIVSFD